jgi:hypothetical protein
VLLLAEQGDGAVPDQAHGRLEGGHEEEQRRADELLGIEPVRAENPVHGADQ